jgi:DnaJ-domain-containing protein 1
MRRLAALALFAAAGLLALLARHVAGDDAGAVAVVPEPELVTPPGFDPYAVLGVDHSASRAEIRRAAKAMRASASASAASEGAPLLAHVDLALSILGTAAPRAKWDAAHGITSSVEEL